MKKEDKISLNDEGILLRCREEFISEPKRIKFQSGRPIFDINNVKKGEVLMFVGCWHFQDKIKMNRLQSRYAHKLDPIDLAFEDVIISPAWITSLHFLREGKVIKITWSGIDKFDQLFEAAKFMYSHFEKVKE